MATLYLIRHGEIDANVQRLWFGSTDADLNAQGESQAKALGEVFFKRHSEVKHIYASPMKRTLQTAASLVDASNITLQPHGGLREFGLGEWEGQPHDFLERDYQFYSRMSENPGFTPPGGESALQVRDRVVAALTEIRDRHRGEHVAIVSHGAAMGIALSHLLEDIVFPFGAYHMKNTAISKLVWHTAPELEFFNHADHLLTTA